jgi:hypothetical protein
MLIHPDHSSRYLIELSDFTTVPLHPIVERHYASLMQVVDWSHSYLSNPHPELGRKGPVCPFVQPSMQRRLYYMAVEERSSFTPNDIDALLMEYRNWFLTLSPDNGKNAQYKTILILFPNIKSEDIPTLIDETQARLKPQYVTKGIMIGEFHAGPPDKAGLWNPDFRPLYCPIPMLVIRHMVPTDFPFLKDTRTFIDAYMHTFGDSIPVSMRAGVIEQLEQFGIHHETEEMMGERAEMLSSV